MTPSKSDARIQRDVLTELEWDSRVGPTEVGVAVSNRVVTLSGTVASLAKKLAAEDAAHRVAGVLDVANDLVVAPTTGERHDDSSIAAAIRQALLWDVFVPEERIQTTVTNGIVTLRGTVETMAQRDEVARAVGYLAGVRGIDNLIVVKRPSVPKEAVHAAIQDALERRAERDADRIAVVVDAGQVTLIGTVHSWSERAAVLGAARGTRGVDSVVDQLRIAP